MITSAAGALNLTSIRIFADGAESWINRDHAKYYQFASNRINQSHTSRIALELNHQLKSPVTGVRATGLDFDSDPPRIGSVSNENTTLGCKQRGAKSGAPSQGSDNMKKILLTLAITVTGSLSTNAVLAGPSFGVIIGLPPIIIGAPVYRPAPVYYAPAPGPYYGPAPVYYAPAPRYTAPIIVAPGYYGGPRGHGRGHGHHKRDYDRR